MRHGEQTFERVEFSIGTSDYIKINLAVFAAFAVGQWLVMFAAGLLTDRLIGYARPVDFWDFALQPGAVLLFGLPLVLGLTAVMARKRRHTVLTPYGVEFPPQGIGGRRGFVPWPAVAGVAVIRAGFGCLIALRLVDNRTLRIAPPYALRRGAPGIAAALATFREHARRYGGRVDAPVRSARAVFATVALVGFGLLAATGLVRLATAPVIPPWAPYASALPDACEAVERAGLDRHWPRAQREPPESRTPEAYRGERRECRVSAASETSALGSMTVAIESEHGYVLRSGAAVAYEGVASRSADEDTATPVEVGDVGYRWQPYDDAVTVAVCRGNVVVTVELDGSGDGFDPGPAGRAAERLAAGVLEQVEFD